MVGLGRRTGGPIRSGRVFRWTLLRAISANPLFDLSGQCDLAAGVRQVVEPLNDIDTPGFLLTMMPDALRLLDDVGSDNLRIQYDVYHMQRMEGNLTATLRQHADRIGHVQVADSPARNQPGTGEINYPFIFSLLDEIGYAGWVGCEYKPAPSTEQSLGWLRDWGYWT